MIVMTRSEVLLFLVVSETTQLDLTMCAAEVKLRGSPVGMNISVDPLGSTSGCGVKERSINVGVHASDPSRRRRARGAPPQLPCLVKMFQHHVLLPAICCT